MLESKLPTHLGIILDGNRRWAKAQGLPTVEGHREGAEVFREIALGVFESGVKYLSAFVFSNENWNRAEEEVGYLMKLVMKAVEKYLDTFDEAGIKIVVLGRKEGIAKSVQDAVDRTEQKTKDNTKGTLALCFNYGGEAEVVDAVKAIIDSKIPADKITPEIVQQHLYHPEIPPLDLIIRTSGEQRLSGFMLYRAAYAELYFAEDLWPDFSIKQLKSILDWYAKRERRFGK